MAIPSISAALPAAPPAKSAASASLARTEHGSETSDTTSAAPSRQQIDTAMKQMRDALPTVARNLLFSVDEATGQSIVKIVDSSTNEVIRQIPSKELLSIAQALDKFTGLLLKQKV